MDFETTQGVSFRTQIDVFFRKPASTLFWPVPISEIPRVTSRPVAQGGETSMLQIVSQSHGWRSPELMYWSQVKFRLLEALIGRH